MTGFSPRIRRFWKALPVRSRGLVILSIPAVCLLWAVGVFASYQSLLAQNQRLVLEVKQIKLITKQISVGLSTAETSIQNYGLTRNPAFLESYHAAVADLLDAVDKLKSLLSNRPEQQTIAELEVLMSQSLSQLEKQRSQVDTLQQLMDSTQTYRWLLRNDLAFNQTQLAIDRLIEQEEQRLEQFQLALEQQQQQGFQLTWIFLVIGLLATALAIALFRQLTQELANREQQLQQANVRLKQANDRLHRFTADASHELRAPVAAILGQAQAGLLADDSDQQAPRQRLQKIVDITKSMATLVNNLLFLARHETTTLSVPAIDIVPLLSHLGETYANEAAQRQIHFSTHFPTPPVMVRVEPDLFKQAIANLLDNALRYTPAVGEIQFQMTLHPSSVVIHVHDTGIGIPDKDIPYIFDRFYRVDQVRSKTGGFGLGLAIAQQIIQSFGGEITVTSEVGKGSQFQIMLPITPAAF